jgi:hypothetical protein
MNLFVIGLFIGALAGVLVGSAYDHWRVSNIVETTILSYRVDEEERKKERLQQYIDDMKGGEE